MQYNLSKQKRPSLKFCQKLSLKLFNSPFNKFYLVRLFLKKQFNLPISTNISSNFYCSGDNICVGEHTSFGDNTYLREIGGITIGHHCSFSYKNMILTGTHDFANFNIVLAKPVVIGDNVWITSNVTILPGVTIGSNTVIGAGSVVTHDIPPGVLAAGNPCKVIKKILFSIE